jgi:hypothetical protein
MERLEMFHSPYIRSLVILFFGIAIPMAITATLSAWGFMVKEINPLVTIPVLMFGFNIPILYVLLDWHWNYLIWDTKIRKRNTPVKEPIEIDNFTNVGCDEEGHTIGNCCDCGTNGVLVNEHICEHQPSGFDENGNPTHVCCNQAGCNCHDDTSEYEKEVDHTVKTPSIWDRYHVTKFTEAK